MPFGRPEFSPGTIFPRPWGNFSYTQLGGGPPILWIHGYGRSRLDWTPIVPYLRKRRHIAPDLRGHGGSSVPHPPLALHNLTEDILALADHLWLGTFDIVGHSLGGIVALDLLRSHPERVGRIVLLDSWPALRYRAAFVGDPLEGLSPELAESIVSLHHDTLVRWVWSLREDFWATVEGFDASDWIRETRRPIAAMYGDRGREPPSQEKLGWPRRSNFTIEWIHGAGHFFPLTHVKETGEALRKMLLPDDGEKDAKK